MSAYYLVTFTVKSIAALWSIQFSLVTIKSILYDVALPGLGYVFGQCPWGSAIASPQAMDCHASGILAGFFR
ncbi:MAG TPA: hypothetical protein P5533_03960 [Candidatus Cloacimonadota bacterium]|nr:hypothetical protein [Candidatus Cloacimonadota bacterium]